MSVSIQIIGPRQYVQAIKQVIDGSFSDLKAVYHEYEHFSETADILRKIKIPTDIVFFAGYLPYTYVKPLLPKDSVCSYLHVGRDFVVKGLFAALNSGYTISKISIDTFNTKSVQDTFAELGLAPQKHQALVIPHQESRIFEDVELIMSKHIHNFKTYGASVCLTAIYVVYKRLQQLNIPSVYMLPTYARIEDSIRTALLELAHLNELESGVVVLKIKIDSYSEHSVYKNSMAQQAVNRGQILGHLYLFAESVHGALIEDGACFWLFVSNSRLLSVTDNLKELYIQSEIASKFANTISVGIGYGQSILQAKYSAEQALSQAELNGSNQTYLVKDGVSLPLYGYSRNAKREDRVDNALVAMSGKTGVSINNLFKLISVIQSHGSRKTFTSKELAMFTKISKRTMDRLLEKLEECGYCKFVGKKSQPASGRPSRIIKFKITE